MEKIDKFVIFWYSKIVFNTLNNSTKLIFRKLETETRKLTAEKLHQKFNEIYIYIYCMKPTIYCRYVDDIFIIADFFFQILNERNI